MKIVLSVVLVLFLLAGIVLALPFLVDLARYEDHYKPLIEGALNRKVTLQNIRLTIWPRIGARVGGLTVLDDPSFSAGPFVSLTSLEVGVKFMPLLSGRVEVEDIALRHPVITIIKNQAGVTNVSTIGGTGPTQTSAQQPEAPVQPTGNPLQVLALFAVDHVSITGGNVTYRDLSTPTPTEYQIHNLELALASVHLGESPTIRFGATVQPFNLPVTLDGRMGPLTETLDIKQLDFTFVLGKTALHLAGSFVGGNLDTTVSAPSIKTSDLPIPLSLNKPVEIKGLSLAAKTTFPLKAGASPLELADITDLRLGIVMGHSAVTVKGSVLGGQADVAVSSPSINSADLPVTTPFAKPVELKDLYVAAKTRKPFTPDAPPLELADVSDLRFGIALGKSVVSVKGSVLGGQAKVTASSPSINTADLPIETPFAKPVDLKNVQLTADMRGQHARLTNLSFVLFDGSTKAQGTLEAGAAIPPFSGTVTLQGVQLGSVLDALGSTALSVSGTARASLSVKGRGFSMPDLTRVLEGTGHFGAKDGRIEGMNLVQEAVTLFNAAGIPLDNAKATVFTTAETDFAIKQGVITIQKLLLTSHEFQATGGGTIGFDQTLNLNVNLNLSPGLSQKIAASSPIGKLALQEGRLRLPLTITGTAQNPSYGLDMKGLTAKAQQQVREKAKETVKGLLEGTTTPQDLQRQGKELLKELFGH